MKSKTVISWAVCLGAMAMGAPWLTAGCPHCDQKIETPPGMAVVKEWHGCYSGWETPMRVVAKDEESWELIWFAARKNQTIKPETPKIDFTKNQVLAVFMGSRPTGGYTTSIIKIEDKDKRIVTVREKSPPPDGGVTCAVTTPYHLVVIPKTAKAVEFADEKP